MPKVLASVQRTDASRVRDWWISRVLAHTNAVALYRMRLTLNRSQDNTPSSDKRERMMPVSVRFGTNDVPRARACNDAMFGAPGVGPSVTPAEYPLILYNMLGGTRFLSGPARDGEAATDAYDGTCERDPKPQARRAFGSYLRNPSCNQISTSLRLAIG
jgi:hypothetical protein